MADIIDFRAKSKPYRKQRKNDDEMVKFGQIILFSGVRIERDEITTSDSQTNKSTGLLSTKSN